MSGFWHATYEVARKEVIQHVRTKRLLFIAIFFFISLQLLTLIIPLAFGFADEPLGPGDPSWENRLMWLQLNASLFGGLFAVQLMAVVLTADAVCSEWSNRTIFLLLSKPVSRTAFVVGKYVGAMVTLIPALLVLYSLQYLIMQGVYDGGPTGEEVARFFGAMGVLAIGAMAVGAVSLFMSTLTKSTVMSLIMTLLSVFILLPIVGAIGDIVYGVDQDDAYAHDRYEAPDPSDWRYDWSHYVTPAGVMGAASTLLIENNTDGVAFSGLVPGLAPQRPWLSIVSGVVFTGIFVAASVAVVRRRNFE